MIGTHTTSACHPQAPSAGEDYPSKLVEFTLSKMLRPPNTQPEEPLVDKLGLDREVVGGRHRIDRESQPAHILSIRPPIPDVTGYPVEIARYPTDVMGYPNLCRRHTTPHGHISRQNPCYPWGSIIDH